MIDTAPEIQEKPQDTSPLEYLVRHLRLAKTEEENIKAKRIMIEEKIAALIPGPERGQKTIKLADGSSVTVERGFNYKSQTTDIETLCTANGLACPIKVKTTRELDVTGYEWYRENDASNFSKIAEFVVSTPKKISVTIKDKK